jgi:hypothetical protein
MQLELDDSDFPEAGGDMPKHEPSTLRSELNKMVRAILPQILSSYAVSYAEDNTFSPIGVDPIFIALLRHERGMGLCPHLVDGLEGKIMGMMHDDDREAFYKVMGDQLPEETAGKGPVAILVATAGLLYATNVEEATLEEVKQQSPGTETYMVHVITKTITMTVFQLLEKGGAKKPPFAFYSTAEGVSFSGWTQEDPDDEPTNKTLH